LLDTSKSIRLFVHAGPLLIFLASRPHGLRVQVASAHLQADASEVHRHAPRPAKALAMLLLQVQCVFGWQLPPLRNSTSMGPLANSSSRSVSTHELQFAGDRRSIACGDISMRLDKVPGVPLARRSVVSAGLAAAGLVVGGTVGALTAQPRASLASEASANLKGTTTAALAYTGSYPCVKLVFPKLVTPEGAVVSLKLAVDTGARVNTISTRVARLLNLKMARGIEGSPVELGEFLLGSQQNQMQLEGQQLFRTTATALPVASPVIDCVGLLGLSFLNAFPGGVEFNWGNEANGSAPSITLHGDKAGIEDGIESHNLVKRVPIEVLTGTGLPSVTIKVNGVAMQALLDTGSPITLINIPAASLAGVEPINPFNETDVDFKKNWWSRFSQLPSWWNRQTRQRSTEQENARKAEIVELAAARGDVLKIAGLQGGVSEIRRSTETTSIMIGDAEFPAAKVYVGNLASWYASNLPGLEPKYPYYGFGAVLGLDVLRSRPGMLYRADEVFF